MVKRYPTIYVSGPYRAEVPALVDENIMLARHWGKEVAGCGAYPVIPHSNTAHFDGLPVDWIAATCSLCARCDAILLTPRWQTSEGSVAEFNTAKEIGLSVFDALTPGWIEQVRRFVADFHKFYENYPHDAIDDEKQYIVPPLDTVNAE